MLSTVGSLRAPSEGRAAPGRSGAPGGGSQEPDRVAIALHARPSPRSIDRLHPSAGRRQRPGARRTVRGSPNRSPTERSDDRARRLRSRPASATSPITAMSSRTNCCSSRPTTKTPTAQAATRAPDATSRRATVPGFVERRCWLATQIADRSANNTIAEPMNSSQTRRAAGDQPSDPAEARLLREPEAG